MGQPKNPILAYDQWSIKDACCAWRDGLFTVFFSAFDQERSRVAAVTTADFCTYSDFLFCLDGRADGHISLCSPDISRVGDTYILTLNSWGDDPENPNQLFYMQSPDLVQWSERRPLAANLTRGARCLAVLDLSGKECLLAQAIVDAGHRKAVVQ
jgi:predicted GH43/DUF377 family glycosyl hydrolase